MSSSTGDAVVQLLNSVLLGRRAQGTLRFRELRHNRDLLPIVEHRVSAVLKAYELHRAMTYDVQGLRDEGADVVVRLTQDEGSPQEYVCFQVKAHDELGHPRIASLLREQHSRAVDRYEPMLRYYILPFGVADVRRRRSDGTAVPYPDDRRDVVRNIAGEFVRKPDVVVVEPSFLSSFVDLTEPRIDAFVTSILGEGDPVRRQFDAELSSYSTHQLAVILRLAALWVVAPSLSVSADDVASDPSVARALDAPELWRVDGQWENSYDSAGGDADVAACLTELADVIDVVGDRVRLATTAFPAVMALLHDAHVRFGHDAAALVDYGMWLQRIADPAVVDALSEAPPGPSANPT